MTYAKAMDLIDDSEDTSDLAKDLRTMRDITRKLRKRREDAGAVMLASNEVFVCLLPVAVHTNSLPPNLSLSLALMLSLSHLTSPHTLIPPFLLLVLLPLMNPLTRMNVHPDL